MEILVNKDFGGYILSLKAKNEILKRKGIKFYIYRAFFDDKYNFQKLVKIDENQLQKLEDIPFCSVLFSTVNIDCTKTTSQDDLNKIYDEDDGFDKIFESRIDKDIIEIVKRLVALSMSKHSTISIEEIPDGSFYEIHSYDGAETIYYSASEILHK